MYAARRPLAQPANLQAERDKSGACSTASKVLFGGDNASPRPALNQCLIETSHLRAKCDRKRAHGDWGIAWRFFCAARRFLFAHRTPPGADSFICRERVQSVPGAFGRFVFIAVDGSAPHLRCFACATRTFCSAHIVYLCVVSFYSPNRPPAPPPLLFHPVQGVSAVWPPRFLHGRATEPRSSGCRSGTLMFAI